MIILIYILIFIVAILIGFVFFYGPPISAADQRLIKRLMAQPVPSQLYGGETGRAIHDGIHIYYEHIKAAPTIARGETILLINGLGHSMLNWPKYLITHLLDSGYDIIRYDNRDVGLSDWIDDWGPGQYYSLSDMTADGIAALDACRVRQAHIIGASMGGMIAQTMAIEHPDRCLSLCSIMSTGHFYDKSTPGVPLSMRLGLLKIMWRYVLLPSERNECMAQLTIWRMLRGKGTYSVNREEIIHRTLFEIRERGGFNKKSTRHHGVAIAKSGSRLESLPEVQLPTLVLHGTNDPLVLIQHAEQYAPLIPNAKTHYIKGMGHDLPKHFAEEINATILKHLSEVSVTEKQKIS